MCNGKEFSCPFMYSLSFLLAAFVAMLNTAHLTLCRRKDPSFVCYFTISSLLLPFFSVHAGAISSCHGKRQGLFSPFLMMAFISDSNMEYIYFRMRFHTLGRRRIFSADYGNFSPFSARSVRRWRQVVHWSVSGHDRVEVRTPLLKMPSRILFLALASTLRCHARNASWGLDEDENQ